MSSVDRKVREIVIEYVEYESMPFLLSRSSSQLGDHPPVGHIGPASSPERPPVSERLLAERENEKTSFRVTSLAMRVGKRNERTPRKVLRVSAVRLSVEVLLNYCAIIYIEAKICSRHIN
jgi:hypothetical protein